VARCTSLDILMPHMKLKSQLETFLLFIASVITSNTHALFFLCVCMNHFMCSVLPFNNFFRLHSVNLLLESGILVAFNHILSWFLQPRESAA
jgi:hypothetical protein